jgi:hypothetical protein
MIAVVSGCRPANRSKPVSAKVSSQCQRRSGRSGSNEDARSPSEIRSSSKRCYPACADHAIAYRMRKLAGLGSEVIGGLGVSGDSAPSRIKCDAAAEGNDAAKR